MKNDRKRADAVKAYKTMLGRYDFLRANWPDWSAEAHYNLGLAYEESGWNDKAIEIFKLNFENVLVFHDDIIDCSIDLILEKTGLQSGDLDILDGSPPCQGFSLSGKRIFNDNRNQLFQEFVRILRGIKPKVFVMENVSGLIEGKMKLIFAEIMVELKNSGYNVKAKLIDMKWFGVPQSRKRIIFIGIRDDLNLEPSFPDVKYKPIIFYDAVINIDDYMDRNLSEIIMKYSKFHPKNKWTTNYAIYEWIKGNKAGAISLKFAQWDQVCGTVLKKEISLSGIVHPNRKRYLNISEIKRIGGFPDQFEFQDRKYGHEFIGNSVPPPFMMIIAEHIKKRFLKNEE